MWTVETNKLLKRTPKAFTTEGTEDAGREQVTGYRGQENQTAPVFTWDYQIAATRLNSKVGIGFDLKLPDYQLPDYQILS